MADAGRRDCAVAVLGTPVHASGQLFQWVESDFAAAEGQLEEFRDLYVEGSVCHGMIDSAIGALGRSTYWYWEDTPSGLLDDDDNPAAGLTGFVNGRAAVTTISWNHSHHWTTNSSGDRS